MNAARAEAELKARKITTIINCAQTPELKDVFDEDAFHYVRMNMVEHPFPTTFDATSIFSRGVDEVKKVLESGEHVLVHCVGGMCRSPSIVVAYLIREKQVPFAEAQKMVRKLRPVVEINKVYQQQLAKWSNKHLQPT